jgi:hypothetical protein
MHSHITHTDVDFPLYIAKGVLGIRNMGGRQEQVFDWQAKLKAGSLLGPLAYVSGPILDGPNGPVQPASYAVRIANAEEARTEVDDLKARRLIRLNSLVCKTIWGMSLPVSGQKSSFWTVIHFVISITLIASRP